MEAPTMDHVLKAVDCSLIDSRPVFSFDSKYLFVTCGTTVRVYATETGNCVHKLPERDRVTAVLVNPRNQLQLVVCTLPGQVSLWDYVDGIEHKRYDIGLRIDGGVWMPPTDRVLYVATDERQLMAVDDWTTKEPRTKLIFWGVDDCERQVAFGAGGEFVVLAVDNKLTVRLTASDRLTQRYSSNKLKFSCVAAHPTDYCAATGDQQGKIFVWYNIQTDEYVKRTLHWHQLPVADLRFSASGAHLLSVGGECVLVKWKLDTESDVNKYTPRLGMPMRWVTCSADGALVATCHTDNAIHLVNGRGKLLLVVQGITQSHLWQDPPLPAGLAVDPRSGALVTNGKPGHVQFYSLREDKQLFNLDITRQNYRHREREFDVSLLDVTRAALDSRGDWLATVEVRDDAETSIDVKLKFWKFAPRIDNFSLNTTVELPHSLAVNALRFRPGRAVPCCVSTSDDRRYKTWALVEDSDVRGNVRANWSCESVGYYRQEKAGDAAFNEDGSLLAVVFGRAITLWDPDTNALRTTLLDPFCRDEVKRIEFGLKLLVSVTADNVCVWNALESTVEARTSRRVVSLTKDPRSEYLAAVDARAGELIVFAPDDLDRPVHRQRVEAADSIVAGIFVPRLEPVDGSQWERESQLYLMDARMQLFAVTIRESDDEIRAGNNVAIQKNVPETPLAVLLSQKVSNESADAHRQQHHQQQQKESAAVEDIFSCASNVLPCPQKQCVILHRQLFLERKKADESAVESREEAIKTSNRKRNDSLCAVEMKKDKDVQWTLTFDWLSNLFIKL
uniref:WD repeat-containing protein 75 second beta-propeller domain-containing protein n=1 Tax=Strigamia maritima TaxID=126957 RepID=T1JFS5_STRMM